MIGLLMFLLSVGTVLSNDRPIIGILAQEIEQDDPYVDYNYTSYLSAAYVKAVESSGARVVPVFIRRDAHYYKDLGNKLNGFLYTGGSSNLMSRTGVARSGKLILDNVLELKKSGVNVPILGVCQGFELLAVLSNGWEPVLSDCPVENEALNLKMVPGFRNSSLYANASDEDITTLTKLESTSNHHGSCLTHKNITKFDLNQWQVLSDSISHAGYVFVSTMEWKGVPIAGVQFHPEKTAYEWNPKQANPHDAKSIKANRLFYDWLAAQSRLNDNKFDNLQQEQDNLIYNYNPLYTGKEGGYDTQNYYFNDPPGILENTIQSITAS